MDKRIVYSWKLNTIDGARGLLVCSKLYTFEYVNAVIKIIRIGYAH